VKRKGGISRRQFFCETGGLGIALAGKLGPLGASPAIRTGKKLPNVLWIMTDDQRPDSLGCYGAGWARTPNIDRIAERGVLFEHAVAQCPVCMPSRTSILTGKYCHTLGILENVRRRVPESVRPLTAPFIERGYQTVNIGKLHYAGKRPFSIARPSPGYGGRAATPFALKAGYDPKKYGVVNLPTPLNVIIAGRYPLPEEKTEPAMCVEKAIDFLQSEAKEPFLLKVSIIAPHTPVLPPRPYDTLIDPSSVRLPLPSKEELEGKSRYEREVLREFQGNSTLTPEQIATARAHYYGFVAMVDHHIGRLLAAVKKRGLMSNTIVAFASDQGVELGEHGIFMKRNFYEQTVKTPLILSWPGRLPEGKRVASPVEMVDFLPTLLELAGLSFEGETAGKSLAKLAQGQRKAFREATFSEIDYGVSQWPSLRDGGGRRVMVRTQRWKMCCFVNQANRDGDLYDLKADPGETKNLFLDKNYSPVISKLSRLLSEWNGKG